MNELKSPSEVKRYTYRELHDLLVCVERCAYGPEGMTARGALGEAFAALVLLSNQPRGPKVKRHRSETIVQTDPLFIQAVVREFGDLTVDLAANESNHQADIWLGPGAVEADSLGERVTWWANSPNQWLNPPFDPILPWVRKAHTQALLANGHQREFPGVADFRLLLLCPLAVGTRWWRDHVEPWATPIAVGRQTFVGSEYPFPKDLALCVYQARPCKAPGKLYRWDWKNTALSAEIKKVLA